MKRQTSTNKSAIIGQGTHEELARGGFYAELYEESSEFIRGRMSW
jgi:ABC-type multidrug transport system fused ATPase/permease subunit